MLNLTLTEEVARPLRLTEGYGRGTAYCRPRSEMTFYRSSRSS